MLTLMSDYIIQQKSDLLEIFFLKINLNIMLNIYHSEPLTCKRVKQKKDTNL
jgi:hypothetical protein